MIPRPASGLAPGHAPPALAEPHLVPLAGEWALWRDIAVRTAGFPVAGLGIFGSPDEQAGLRSVARDPLFRTAVTWQNRAAMRNAVDKIAAGATASGSRQRQREEVVASYWQRYCAKNDTIGFFGPLAWGRAADDGPAIQASCGQLVSESTVHFEAWAIQALAEALDPDLTVAVGPHSERDLRAQLERSRPELRDRGQAALDRLEGCRSAAARAVDPGALDTALGDLDQVFEELTGRSALLADPDPATIAVRAAATFADHAPAWPTSVYQSADIQIAAPSAAALNAGDYLCVVGDFHPGANPLGQGVFATRHPDRDRFLAAIASDVGPRPFLVPPRDVGFHTTRNMPATTRPGDVHVAANSRDRMPDGYRTLPAADLITDGQTITTPDGSWQASLAHLLWLPLMISAVHAYDPFPATQPDGHGTRITIRRTVWRRETWHIAPAIGPACSEAAARWARDLGLPRRVFLLSPGELKPIYIDFDSPVLARVLCRQLRRATADFPGQPARFTEMLPGPDDCWLADEDGQRYTSELRLVAVDLERRASRRPARHC